jgi:hypothetical protein
MKIVNADPNREGDDRGPTPPFSLWAELGLPEPEPLGEGQAPPVDWEILRRLVRQELPEQAARMTFRLIDSYSEWNAAHAKLLVDEFKSRNKDAPS